MSPSEIPISLHLISTLPLNFHGKANDDNGKEIAAAEASKVAIASCTIARTSILG